MTWRTDIFQVGLNESDRKKGSFFARASSRSDRIMLAESSQLAPEQCSSLQSMSSQEQYCFFSTQGPSLSNPSMQPLHPQPILAHHFHIRALRHIRSSFTMHWGHIMNFKISTITFKVLHVQHPFYLAALIPRYMPTLWSFSSLLQYSDVLLTWYWLQEVT